ncbi:ABC transporter permease [Pseudactinotalea sp. HY158]|uniref:ABC transporter permease n=1 Tax=Pseudactinotalea sp. HY158 TaxID=2654547 RepID=UPI00129D0BA7|nr:hypothetical protein [Pseudactinotalea sp. HY158]QGH68652.1 hypothetical protein GCE65_03400 [Pseudactinotalea sp. HY158]
MSTAAAAPLDAVRTPLRRESPLTGLGHLSRHIVRRDRVRMVVWAASVVVFVAYFVFALSTVFDPSALAARAAVMRTPSGIVMGGPGYGLDHYTAPVAVANEGTMWIVLALAIMSIMHVVRHTRAAEGDGQAELVRAAAVGRHAPGVATMLTLAVHLLVIAVLSAATMVAVGTGLSAADAFAMMLGCAASALVFGAAALVASQVSVHARTASGLSLAVVAGAFVVRAAGDIRQPGGSLLSWFSPIAWAQQLRAFVDLRWWPVLLSVVVALVLLGLAALLATRRDFGAGLLESRPGPATARAGLRSPVRLAWLQQRGTLLWTTVGLGLMWFGTGTLMSTLNDMVADLVGTNPVLGRLFGTDPAAFTSSFLAVVMLFVSLCAAAYAIVMGLRPRAEESAGRLEVTLATPVSRTRWLGAQVLVAGIGTVVLLAVSVYGLWLGSILVGVDEPGLADYSLVLVGRLPAVLVFLALPAALFAWWPRFAGLAWILLAYVFVGGMFGQLFDLPEWVLGISPFHWVPEAFGPDPDLSGVAGLVAALVALGALAFAGFRRRDVLTA